MQAWRPSRSQFRVGGCCMTQSVALTVNGRRREDEVEPRLLLVHYLREVAGLTGTHIACDTSQCGACTVLIDGEAVKSCSVFAVQADGRAVTTIEGLADGRLPPPGPAGVLERARTAVRLLHPGFHHGRAALPPQAEPDADRRRDRAGPRGQSLPLHRLHQHQEGGAGPLERDEGGSAESPASSATGRRAAVEG